MIFFFGGVERYRMPGVGCLHFLGVGNHRDHPSGLAGRHFSIFQELLHCSIHFRLNYITQPFKDICKEAIETRSADAA